MTIYGYARVSTEGQSLAAQREALQAAGAERIFEEKQSGASAHNRKALQRAIAAAPKDLDVLRHLLGFHCDRRHIVRIGTMPCQKSQATE